MFHRALRCSYLSAQNCINTRNKYVSSVYRIFTGLSEMDFLNGLIDSVCHFVSSLKQTYWILTHMSNVYIFFLNLIHTFSLISKIFTWRGIIYFLIYGVWLYSNMGTVTRFFSYLPNAFWLITCICLFIFYYLNSVWLKCSIILVWGVVFYWYREFVSTVLQYCLAIFLLIFQ